jgi:hypothetical protein
MVASFISKIELHSIKNADPYDVPLNVITKVVILISFSIRKNCHTEVPKNEERLVRVRCQRHGVVSHYRNEEH